MGAVRVLLALAALLAALLLATGPAGTHAQLNPAILDAIKDNPIILQYVARVTRTEGCKSDATLFTLDILQCPKLMAWFDAIAANATVLPQLTCEPTCRAEFTKLSDPCFFGLQTAFFANGTNADYQDIGNTYLNACFGRNTPSATVPTREAAPLNPNIVEASYANPLVLRFVTAVRLTPACSNDTAMPSVDINQCPNLLAWLAEVTSSGTVRGAPTCEDSCRREYAKLSAPCIAGIQESLTAALEPRLADVGPVYLSSCLGTASLVLEEPPTPAPEPAPEEVAGSTATGSSLSGGAIAGIAVGSLVVVGALVAALLVFRRRRQQASKQAAAHAPLVFVASFDDEQEKGIHLDGKAPDGSSRDNGGGGAAFTADPTQQQQQRKGGLMGNSLISLESDPVLGFIASHLDSRTHSAAWKSQLSDAPTPTQRSETPLSVAMNSLVSTGSDAGPGMAQWAVEWDEIHMQRFIGRGSAGRVYLALWRETQVAAKVLLSSEQLEEGLDTLELPQSVLRELHKEAQLLARIRHPHIVSFMGLCSMPPCILTEYCPHGSVYEMLGRAKRGQLDRELTWELRLRMAIDAATGLHYLHSCSPPVLHRDVKSPNLLVDESFRVKVTDFNLSKLLQQEKQTSDSSAGATNPTWLAPEVLAGSKSTTATDVYGFGLVMYELLTWQLPWSTSGPSYRTVQLVLRGERPTLPPLEELPGYDSIPTASLEHYCQLMSECWAQEPEDRPSFASVVPRLRTMLEQLLGSGGGGILHSAASAEVPE